MVADTFAKFGLNIDLLNPNAIEEESKVESARNTGAQPRSCKVDALLDKIPDFGFLTDEKLSIDELFI